LDRGRLLVSRRPCQQLQRGDQLPGSPAAPRPAHAPAAFLFFSLLALPPPPACPGCAHAACLAAAARGLRPDGVARQRV